MDRIFTVYIGALLNTIVAIYCCLKISSVKVKIFNVKCLAAIIVMSIYLGTIYISTTSYMKIAFSYTFLVVICTILYKIPIIKSSLASFITLTLNLISEIIYATILVLIFNIKLTTIRSDIFGGLFHNICILVIMLIIVSVKPLMKLLNTFIDNIVETKAKKAFIILLLSVLAITMLVYYIYFEVNFVYTLIFCFIFIFMYTFLIFSIFNEKNKLLKLEHDYEIMINSLSEYEKLYSYQRMLNHEFKNDLMVIRGMAYKKNKKLINYIDNAANFKNIKDEKWMCTLRRIPEGGLLGLLYFKLLSMEKQNINISFMIGAKFKTNDYKNISENIKNKICKILGIYLDNSIDAVNNLKEKNVSITIDEEYGNILIIISNNFEGKIDATRIFEKGYTTNGIGRGYGLAIAKEIIETNRDIINSTTINGNVFTQQIQIKM